MSTIYKTMSYNRETKEITPMLKFTNQETAEEYAHAIAHTGGLEPGAFTVVGTEEVFDNIAQIEAFVKEGTSLTEIIRMYSKDKDVNPQEVLDEFQMASAPKIDME